MSVYDLRPQLCRHAASLADVGAHPDDLVLEPKFDGFRIMAHRHHSGLVTLHSRTEVQTGKLPLLEAELERIMPPGTVLDGEVGALRVVDGRVENRYDGVARILLCGAAEAAARERVEPLTFYAFDVLYHAGDDVRPVPWFHRRALLDLMVPNRPGDRVRTVATLPARQAVVDALLDRGWEGAVVKRRAAPYVPGRPRSPWWRIKGTWTVDAVVTGFSEGGGKYAGMVGALKFAQYRDGRLVERGQCSGMTDEQRRSMTDAPGMWLGRVVEVQHNGVLHTGLGLRHPQFKGVRFDKAPEMCDWTDG